MPSHTDTTTRSQITEHIHHSVLKGSTYEDFCDCLDCRAHSLTFPLPSLPMNYTSFKFYQYKITYNCSSLTSSLCSFFHYRLFSSALGPAGTAVASSCGLNCAMCSVPRRSSRMPSAHRPPRRKLRPVQQVNSRQTAEVGASTPFLLLSLFRQLSSRFTRQ